MIFKILAFLPFVLGFGTIGYVFYKFYSDKDEKLKPNS